MIFEWQDGGNLVISVPSGLIQGGPKGHFVKIPYYVMESIREEASTKGIRRPKAIYAATDVDSPAGIVAKNHLIIDYIVFSGGDCKMWMPFSYIRPPADLT